MDEKVNRVKQHLAENWYWYASVAVVVSAGALVYKTKPTISAVINGSDNNQIIAPNATSIINMLERRGHPGNVIRCLETGEVFASQNRAAEVFGTTPSRMSSHIHGLTKNINGLHFEKLGEAVA